MSVRWQNVSTNSGLWLEWVCWCGWTKACEYIFSCVYLFYVKCGTDSLPFSCVCVWLEECSFLTSFTVRLPVGMNRQNPGLPGRFVVILTLEKPPLLSNPRPNTIQSVRKWQKGMRWIRSPLLCSGALPFHTSQHSTPAHTKQSISHTFPIPYLLHLWDPYLSTLPTHISHSPYVCVSTAQHCMNLRRNRPIGMLRPGQH